MTHKRIMVTGGSGFIGSAVVRTLVAEGCDVMNIDLMTYAATKESTETAASSPHYSFRHADIADAAAMADAYASFQPDAVLHLAAESHVDQSIDAPLICLHTNVTGTVTLLQEGLKYWQALKGDKRDQFRFLHVSTDEVYGSAGENDIFTLNTPYRPNSPYSASKAASDHFVRAWYKTYGMPTLITHCSNNYGSFQFPEKLIPTVILSALNERPIPIYGEGKNIREWLHVQDHVEALKCVLERGVIGETYNIGSHDTLANIDLVKQLCSKLDRLRPRKGNRLYEELMTFVQDRPGHDLKYAIDSSEICGLGWRPQINLSDGLEGTVLWYLDNITWWQSLIKTGHCGVRKGLQTSQPKNKDSE